MSNQVITLNGVEYNLNDPTVYQWRIWKPKRNVGKAIFMLVFMALAMPLLPYAVLHFIHWFWPALAVWVAWGGIGIAIFATSVLLYARLTEPREKSIKNSTGLYSLATLTLGAILYLVVFGSPVYLAGFQGPDTPTFWTWSLFFFDNLLGVLLLDVPDIYNWSVSGIQPISHLACLTTVAIRILITIGLVDMLLSIYRLELSEETFFCSVRECGHYCDALLDAEDLLLARIGAITPTSVPPVVAVEEFVRAVKPKLQ